MRQVLRNVPGRPDHIGLAYGAWARIADDPSLPQDKRGKVPEEARNSWLEALSSAQIADDYKHAFLRWRASFLPPDQISEFTLAARLLVGHGNASPTEVGLTLHQTWGVPVIPGSALKGLLSHYLDATYGPGSASAPWELPDEDKVRAAWQGAAWEGSRMARGPGKYHRALFGSPEAEQDDAMRKRGYTAGASQGQVIFHDALYVPNSVEGNAPFAVDVLTPHQKSYYNGSGSNWPCDYDDPNPVAFLSVRSPARFLLALSGPPDWTELAGALLRDALAEWGVGAKTSAGYGHGKVGDWSVAEPPPNPVLAVLDDWLQIQRQETRHGTTQRTVLERLKLDHADQLRGLNDQDRKRARAAIAKVIKAPNVVVARDAFLNDLWSPKN